jgi:hypothetical protein
MIESIVCLAIAKEVMFAKIETVSKDFGVSKELMEYVVSNESAKDKDGNFLPCGIGDTHLTDPKGNRHISRGIVQINEYWNPHIRPMDAYNVSFSLEFLASRLREGKCSMWTTCRAYKTHYGGLPYPHSNG